MWILILVSNIIPPKHCFDFLLGLTMVSEETGNNAVMQNFGGTNKEYYGTFDTG